MRRISLMVLAAFLVMGVMVPHASAENENICFSFPDVSGLQGTEATIGLQVTDADAILAVDATVTYPADKVTGVSASKTAFSDDMLLVANFSTPGQVKIAMAGAAALSGDGELFQIVFELTGAPGEIAGIHLTSIKINEVSHTDCIQNGSIWIIQTPVVTTDLATSVGCCAATLRGTVNPGGGETSVSFEWGETEGYGSIVAASEGILTGATDQGVSAPLVNLEPDTTYHFRVKAVNAAGTDYGSDVSFTTTSTSSTLYVSNDGQCGGLIPCYATLQAALDAAADGDTIQAANSLAPEAPVWDKTGTVTISGGWKTDFSGQDGMTSMVAPKATGGGAVKVQPEVKIIPKP